MKWIELSVDAHAEAIDAIANVFQEHGTGGTSIEQAVRSHIEGEEPAVFEGLPTIRAYLPATDDEPTIERSIVEALWHLQAFNLSPVGPLRRREIDEEDWANGWKEHFHPLKIGSIVIKPSWREWQPSSDEVVIELDPGMAFGTGLHPTTSLMLRALQERVRPGIRVLDLGTGSGILAIPAALMGATVEALDVSDVAVEVAEANVERNGVAHLVRIGCATIAGADGQFDLVLANIIASVLIELAPDLYAVLSPDGELLASGIVEERLGSVRDAFRTAGLQCVDERQDGDWWLIVARRAR